MLLSPRKNGLDSLFTEVRVFKVCDFGEIFLRSLAPTKTRHELSAPQRCNAQLRKLEKAVAVSGVCAGVLQESSGKTPGKLLEKFSRIAKCYKF